MLILCLLSLWASPARAQSAGDSQRLIVHEWGMLTTVALEDGSPMAWSPMDGASSQPSFVQRYDRPAPTGNARLDIPAIFFRTDQPLTVAMGMEFLRGHFVTSYPRGEYEEYTLAWPQLTVLPASGGGSGGASEGASGGASGGGGTSLPTEPTTSRYFQLRNTTCAQVRVDHAGHKQFERFIQLRGVGTFTLPLKVRVDDELFHIEQSHDDSLRAKQVIAIESHKGKLGFAIIDLEPGQESFPRLKLTSQVDLATARLRKLLNQQGMYPDEASAVMAAVQPEWFEPGVRLIYLLPSQAVDGLLTCQFTPAASEHLRLYAVRVELMTPQMRRQLLDKLAQVDPENPAASASLLTGPSLIKPMLRQLHDSSEDELLRKRIAGLLETP